MGMCFLVAASRRVESKEGLWLAQKSVKVNYVTTIQSLKSCLTCNVPEESVLYYFK